jgi:hypothetical protein
MGNVIKFEDLPVEAVTEACKEAYEETSWAFERAIEKAINFGRLLCIAKSKVPHGGWSKWVAETFENQASLRSIQRFMQVAESNATNPSLLEGVKTLDEALGLIQVKRVVEIPEAADVPAVGSEIVTSDEHAMATVKPMATQKPVAAKPASPQPATPAKAEPEVEKKSPSVIQIERSLFKMGADKKRHKQLMQIAKSALSRLTEDEHCDVLVSQLMRMSDNGRTAVFRDVNRRIAGVITE